MRNAWFGAVALVLVGCGGGAATGPGAQAPFAKAPEPAAEPAAKPARAAPPADPFALPEGPRDDAAVVPMPGPLSLEAWSRAAAVKGVGPLPAGCQAYAKRAAAKKKPASLVDALAEPDAEKRDAMLVALDDGPPGFLRALRADLAPVACADAIVDPFLAKQKAASGPYGHLLVGLSLAAKLARTAHGPPVFEGTADKAHLKAFYDGPMKAWVIEQAKIIEALGASAAGLEGYGRGVAAIEAGHADLRLVDQVRNGPVPKGWDAELRGVYEAALDQALEPRKARGRDATLVGLSDLTEAGVFADERATRARSLLAKLYGGRRVDALDGLMLPPSDALPPANARDRAAATVSAFWLDIAGPAVTGSEKGAFTSAVLTRGLPRVVRAAMRSGDLRTPEEKALYARARVDLGRVSLRRTDFVESAYAVHDSKRPQDRLVLAVALALASGPNGARALMTAPSPSALGFDHTEALDAVAAEGGPLAGMAAYDAAHLRALATPDGAAAVPWLTDVAERFRRAETLLTVPEQKALAGKRAAEAEAIRDAITKR